MPHRIDYSDMVATLAKPGDAILHSLTPIDCHILHMTVGVAGEAGELLDCVKKHVIYRKPLDMDNLIEELGDLEFYMEGLRQTFDITREQCLDANKAKLYERYKGSYSNEAAIARADK